jgi:hypothetical protein
MPSNTFTAVVLLLGLAAPASAQTAAGPDALELFVLALEQAAASGERAKVQALAHPEMAAGGVEDFAYSIVPTPSRIVIKERDRTAIEGGEHRLLLEVFVERGREARLSTWRMDVRRRTGTTAPAEDAKPDWRIVRLERLNVVSGLYRLALDPGRQFDVRDLTLVAPDLTVRMSSGTAFIASSAEGPTAVVLLGKGRMVLAPRDEAEQTQIRIFTDSDSNSLDAEFDAAFIRVRPSEFHARFRAESLVARAVVDGDFRRASDVFDEYVGRTLQIDMSDLSRERWSLVPSAGDVIAEVRTRRHGSLTYARTWNDAEDVSVFDRKKRRNIAVYASAEKLAARGRFYSEDDLVDYDILSYDVDAAFSPDKHWVAGNTRITLKVRAMQLSTMSLRLAESLVVRGVYSPQLGRLLHLRIVGQHSLIVNLPVLATRDSEVTLNVVYAGRVEPQELEREAISVTQDQPLIQIPLEPRFIYSNRSYWYPQGSVTDFATARIRITVPPEFDVVASGMPTAPPAPAPGPVAEGERPRRVFVFESERPVRYLACVIGRFATVSTAEVVLDSGSIRVDTQEPSAFSDGEAGGDAQGGTGEGSVSLIVRANPRQAGRARELSAKATEVMKFYASLIGEAPYASFTLAVTESDLPGGHSPPYFAILNQSLPAFNVTWRNDPVAFENYPAFFLAHELAHQWWGQAVGWKNYHEQWISEGFAQYFAILFAEKERGSEVMLNLLRQMRRTAIRASDQGPVYLGYRLGHIRADSRIFRALVYNKAAMVLHMLRRFVGDEAFFSGIRQFYADWRFRKAGTDDFRVAMEKASHRELGTFFDAWIYAASVPRLKFHHEQVEKGVLVRFEHRGEVVPVPITVSITYTSGETRHVVVAVSERVVERTIAVDGPVRRVEANADNAALAEIER